MKPPRLSFSVLSHIAIGELGAEEIVEGDDAEEGLFVIAQDDHAGAGVDDAGLDDADAFLGVCGDCGLELGCFVGEQSALHVMPGEHTHHFAVLQHRKI